MSDDQNPDTSILDREGDKTSRDARITQFSEAVVELKRFERTENAASDVAGSESERSAARDILQNSVRHYGRQISSAEMARSLDRLPPESAKDIAQVWQQVQDGQDVERDREAEQDRDRAD